MQTEKQFLMHKRKYENNSFEGDKNSMKKETRKT